MNPFAKIVAAIRENKALAALTRQQDMPQAPSTWWSYHAATRVRRNVRFLNRTIGHRQVKRNRMAHLRDARTA